MKKVFLQGAICSLVVLSSITFLSAQQVAPVTTAGNISGCAGVQCISIPLTVTGFTKITALSLRMEFDATNITFCSYANINPVLSGFTYGPPVLVNGSTYKLMVTWVDAVPRTLATGAKLFDVKFNLVDGNGTLSFNNSSNAGGDCEYADSVGNALTDIPTNSFYYNASVTVYPLPIPNITGSTSLCVNSGSYYYITEPEMTNYIWTVSSGGTIISGNGTNQIQVTWNSSGSQTVCVNYTNSSGCTATTPTCLDITVSSLPENAGNISGTIIVCAGTSGVAYMIGTIQNATSYIWTLPPGASIASGAYTNSITVNFDTNASSGDMTVYGNNICGNGSASPPFAVTVNPIPPTPIVTADGNILTSNIPTGNQWYLDGTQIPGATDQTYIATLTGNYCSIVTWNNCSSDSSNQIYINIVGNEELKNADWSIDPNPNNGSFYLTIRNMRPDTYTLQVYSNLGMKVYELRDLPVNLAIQKKININPVTEGVYSFILSKKGQFGRKRVIIRK